MLEIPKLSQAGGKSTIDSLSDPPGGTLFPGPTHPLSVEGEVLNESMNPTPVGGGPASQGLVLQPAVPCRAVPPQLLVGPQRNLDQAAEIFFFDKWGRKKPQVAFLKTLWVAPPGGRPCCKLARYFFKKKTRPRILEPSPNSALSAGGIPPTSRAASTKWRWQCRNHRWDSCFETP